MRDRSNISAQWKEQHPRTRIRSLHRKVRRHSVTSGICLCTSLSLSAKRQRRPGRDLDRLPFIGSFKRASAAPCSFLPIDRAFKRLRSAGAGTAHCQTRFPKFSIWSVSMLWIPLILDSSSARNSLRCAAERKAAPTTKSRRPVMVAAKVTSSNSANCFSISVMRAKSELIPISTCTGDPTFSGSTVAAILSTPAASNLSKRFRAVP